MGHRASRREFLTHTALAGAAGSFLTGQAPGHRPRRPDGPKKEDSPNEQVRFACIGVGGKGDSDTNDAGKHGEIVALCDIDEQHARQDGRRSTPRPRSTSTTARCSRRWATRSTPSPSARPTTRHAPASVMAMRMGKHCFCQKPLTWSVEEARVMRDARRREEARAPRWATRAPPTTASAQGVELIRSGVLGPIKEIHVWTNRPDLAAGHRAGPRTRPGIPNHVHWYEFLGPAHDRPYHPDYHPFNWRGWLDFGTGALGDMACHTINVACHGPGAVRPRDRSRSSTPRASSTARPTRSGRSSAPSSASATAAAR